MVFASVPEAGREDVEEAIFTESLSTANSLSLSLKAGNVAVNNVDAGVINAPYGGWKDSGFGHEHGSEGLYEYLNIKHIRI